MSKQVSTHLSLVAGLSAGITVVFGVVYTLLGVLGLIFRADCESAVDAEPLSSHVFLDLLYRLYFMTSECDARVEVAGVTQPHTMLLFLVLTIVASALALIAAVLLVIVVQSENGGSYVVATGWTYVAICGAGLVLDLVLATFLGIDYTTITALHEESSDPADIYFINMAALAALLLMSVALKGYVAHIFNTVLLVLLAVYLVQHQNNLNKHQHPIHKLGALNAYESQRSRQDEPWSAADMYLPPARSPYSNPAFSSDEDPRHPPRDPPPPPRNDYNSRSFDRSDSWHHSRPAAAAPPHSRPFSYLEEPRAPRPAPPSPAPAPWQPPPPPLPVPDYSPHQPRRLKSALKPAYM